MSVERAIRDSYLAAGMTESHLAALAKIARFRVFADGDYIVHQFDETRDLFLITSGQAMICTDFGEPIGVVRAGMPIGEVSFMDNRSRSVSLVSSGICEAVEFPYQPLKDLLAADPGLESNFLRNICGVLCARLRSANKSIAALMAIDECESATRP